MPGNNPSNWVAIVVVAIAFAIFVANAVYVSGVVKALSTAGNNSHLSKGGAKAFLWIDSILAGILGVVLIYLVYEVFASTHSSKPTKSKQYLPPVGVEMNSF